MSGLEVVVVTRNSERDIIPCLDSLASRGNIVRVVDNASSDRTVEVTLQRCPGAAVLRNSENLGYSRAVNLGVARASRDYVLISNADVVYPEGSLEELAAFMSQNPTVGAIGPQLVFPDGSWQRSYANVPGIRSGLKQLLGWDNFRNALLRAAWPLRIDAAPHPVGYIDGAVMLVRRKAFEEIGGFDENLHFYGEDADFCCRLRRAGWEVMFDPQAVVTHVRGASSTRTEALPDKYLEMRARAIHYVVHKHSGRMAARVYRRIEYLHFLTLRLLYRVLRPAIPPSRRTSFDRKLRVFESACRSWVGNFEGNSRASGTAAAI